MTGLQPGRTKLMVNVTFTAVNVPDPIIYHASVDLEVFEPLVLMKPKHIPGKSLLMARHSSIQLETNLDGSAQIEYRYVLMNHILFYNFQISPAFQNSASPAQNYQQ